MTGSIRNFENKNFTPKSRIFVSLKVKLPDMTDWHSVPDPKGGGGSFLSGGGGGGGSTAKS